MKIQNVNDLCDFICSWMNVESDLSGDKLKTPIYIPNPLRTLHSRLGHLWINNNHSLTANFNGQRLGLFEYQNFFKDPESYQRDEFGIVNFWSENQGVFNYGYSENDDYAYADQDWRAPGLTVNDLPPPPEPPNQEYTCWGRTPLTIEQTIIDLLIGDFLLMFGKYLPPDQQLTQSSEDVIVWDSQLWPKYKFWTNSAFEFVTNGTYIIHKF